LSSEIQSLLLFIATIFGKLFIVSKNNTVNNICEPCAHHEIIELHDKVARREHKKKIIPWYLPCDLN